ncbi:B-cell receptor CD22-like [Notolabrus celidotus]|uniref:B-cell receptor CD22-like n=1 Tax=Notolabrus celidotus TaxID=1203425 RepID=UPI00148F4599|nr:B-cell receptor CD22-like [Notolabrus celidotus]
MEGSPVTLTCSSDANPAATYTWYQLNYGQLPTKKAQLYFGSIQSSDSGQYYCEAENDLGRERTSGYTYINVKYAPNTCSVSVSPNGEIIEGSRVTLSCSSDGYPAPEYTWYKVNDHGHHSKGSELVFSQIQSSDSGRYYCAAENDLGMRTSGYTNINVKYAPKLPSVSVSPTAEKVEGSSVTLTCSSDANPAATYTWYKKTGNWRGQQLSINTELVFRSIQSSDSGEYFCEAENKLGSRTSEPFSIDVKYAPKLPSVSVSPSGEVVEGSSVILTCSSDANPVANYTWYKENEDSPKAVGPVFTITDLRAEHSGNYSCEAQNSRGRHNSTLLLIVVTGNLQFKINITKMALMLLMMTPLLVLTLWMRKKKTLSPTIKPNEPVEMIEQVYANVSAILSAQTEDAEEQEDLV